GPPRPPAGRGYGDRGQKRRGFGREPPLAAGPGCEVERRAARALDVPARWAGPRALVLARSAAAAAGLPGRARPRRLPALPGRVHATLRPEHTALDIDALRRGESFDPFAALIDDRAVRTAWNLDGLTVTERVARHPKAAIRRRLLARLRAAIARAGGLWTRLA